MITDKEYADTGGCICIFCGWPDIEGGNFDCDSNIVSQEMSCAYCGGTWTDVYEFRNTANHQTGDR